MFRSSSKHLLAWLGLLIASMVGCKLTRPSPAPVVNAAPPSKVKVDAQWWADDANTNTVERIKREREQHVRQVMEQRQQFDAVQASHSADASNPPSTGGPHQYNVGQPQGDQLFPGASPLPPADIRNENSFVAPPITDRQANDDRYDAQTASFHPSPSHPTPAPQPGSFPSSVAVDRKNQFIGPAAPNEFQPVGEPTKLSGHQGHLDLGLNTLEPGMSADSPQPAKQLASRPSSQTGFDADSKKPSRPHESTTTSASSEQRSKSSLDLSVKGIIVDGNNRRLALLQIGGRDTMRARVGDSFDMENNGTVTAVDVVKINNNSVHVQFGQPKTTLIIR